MNIVLLLYDCTISRSNFLHTSAPCVWLAGIGSSNEQSGIVVCSNDTSVAQDVSHILNRAQEMYTAGAYR
jgi:hypothetical protein